MTFKDMLEALKEFTPEQLEKTAQVMVSTEVYPVFDFVKPLPGQKMDVDQHCIWIIPQ